MRLLALAVPCLVALTACGHRAPPPAVDLPPRPDAGPPPPDAAPDATPPPDAPLPLDRDPAQVARRTIGMFEDLAAATADGDCAAMAARVTALQPRYAELVAAARKLEAAGREREVKAAMKPDQARLGAALDAITRHTATCSSDPALEHAIDQLFGG
jgi:hypothetical protein